MIQVTELIFLDESEIDEEFIRSSGPGGQNVNKVATAVQLRFNAARSNSLPADVKEKLTHIAGRRMTLDGTLIITARKYRTREKNRQDALERLFALIEKACEKQKKRKKTIPSRAAKESRMGSKRKISIKKRNRVHITSHDDL